MPKLKKFFIRDQDKDHNPISDWRAIWGVDEADAIRRDYLRSHPELNGYKNFPRLMEELLEVKCQD